MRLLPARSRLRFIARPAAALALFASGALIVLAQNGQRRWLAGDSHIHSHWSPGYDRAVTPPAPIKGADAIYSTILNAQMARTFGLEWMVTTDHGGPNHSKLNLTQAYEELQASRAAVPEVLQFYGMELNMPAMDHHTLIVPQADDEWRTLFNIESQFDANEVWPSDPARDTEVAAFQLLTYMKQLPRLPLMFANHPSRSATGVGEYGLDEPHEMRNNNDLAPDVYRGMEGAPGHQAAGLAPDGSQKTNAAGEPAGARGSYGNKGAGTFGGFDQMAAIVGGLWDAMLGEGRRFWIVATSDSHANFADPVKPGSDFWPGQYQKTFVFARPEYADILDGMRKGRMFAAAGDLVSVLEVTAEARGASAAAGGTLVLRRGTPEDVKVTIRFRDPEAPNARGDRPAVQRIDLIVGDVTGPARNRDSYVHKSARVAARVTRAHWREEGEWRTAIVTVPAVERDIYLRVRGTSTGEEEPSMDQPGENPWEDLWCYSNPVFVDVR